MFKLVWTLHISEDIFVTIIYIFFWNILQIALSALIALAAAKPSLPLAYSAYQHQPIVSTYSVPSVANVGSIVSHVPTSISSQSSSVVHSHGAVVTPVITPVHKTIIAAPAVVSHASPLTYAAHAAPLAYSHGAPWGLPPLSYVSGWNQPYNHGW